MSVFGTGQKEKNPNDLDTHLVSRALGGETRDPGNEVAGYQKPQSIK